MRINSIQLFSVTSDFGHGANDGAYYPLGLLTIGTYLKQNYNNIKVEILDTHHSHADKINIYGDIVGISASSALNYRNVLKIAEQAKNNNSVVVLGGPHVTSLSNQVLKNRRGLIDFIIRDKGEIPFFHLTKSLLENEQLNSVPNLSFVNNSGNIIHNSLLSNWNYEDYLPLDFSLLPNGITPYWNTFKRKIDNKIDAAFVVFTHFGCGYREFIKNKNANSNNGAKWCVYCSLNDNLQDREGSLIIDEVENLIESNNLKKGSKILLKCYGDNVSTEINLLEDLYNSIKTCTWWKDFNIVWTFYAQSSKLNKRVVYLLKGIGAENLYIGFDSADNRIQKNNGLGTSLESHRRAARLCKEYGIKIQAGFVLGCAGETYSSLLNSYKFALELFEQNLLERINSAVLFIIPGSPAYNMLCEKEPWILELDLLPTEEMQWYWIKHFCPVLADDPSKGIQILYDFANKFDELSPGPHTSMGYLSNKYLEEFYESS